MTPPNRVTLEDINAEIVSEHYFTAADGYAGAMSMEEWFGKLPEDERVISPPAPLDLLTFCVLILKSGYTVVGKSACLSAENFDLEEGKARARENAIDELWPLMGFRLAEAIANAK